MHTPAGSRARARTQRSNIRTSLLHPLKPRRMLEERSFVPLDTLMISRHSCPVIFFITLSYRHHDYSIANTTAAISLYHFVQGVAENPHMNTVSIQKANFFEKELLVIRSPLRINAFNKVPSPNPVSYTTAQAQTEKILNKRTPKPEAFPKSPPITRSAIFEKNSHNTPLHGADDIQPHRFQPCDGHSCLDEALHQTCRLCCSELRKFIECEGIVLVDVTRKDNFADSAEAARKVGDGECFSHL